jgi:hypothetical protein
MVSPSAYRTGACWTCGVRCISCRSMKWRCTWRQRLVCHGAEKRNPSRNPSPAARHATRAESQGERGGGRSTEACGREKAVRPARMLTADATPGSLAGGPSCDVCAWADVVARRHSSGRLLTSNGTSVPSAPLTWRSPLEWDRLQPHSPGRTPFLLTLLDRGPAALGDDHASDTGRGAREE